MKFETTKIDANGISFDDCREFGLFDVFEFTKTIHLTETGTLGLVDRWNRLVKNEVHIEGVLNIVQEASSSPLTRDELEGFMDQIDLEGMLYIHVFYMDAQYPVVDKRWSHSSVINKLGVVSMFGTELSNSLLYSTVFDGVTDHHVRTSGKRDGDLLELVKVVSFVYSGVKIKGDDGVAFDLDSVLEERA